MYLQEGPFLQRISRRSLHGNSECIAQTKKRICFSVYGKTNKQTKQLFFKRKLQCEVSSLIKRPSPDSRALPRLQFHCSHTSEGEEYQHDQVYSCPTDWRLSASQGSTEYPLKTLGISQHYNTENYYIILRGLSIGSPICRETLVFRTTKVSISSLVTQLRVSSL